MAKDKSVPLKYRNIGPEAHLTFASIRKLALLQLSEFVERNGPNLETQQAHKNKVRGIYGKIMANGKPLEGVTVMVPGSGIAKVSNAEGKYYIQVPTNIDSLKFIYQGKQLVKELDPTLRNHDLYLKIDRLTYPQIHTPESSDEIIASN